MAIPVTDRKTPEPVHYLGLETGEVERCTVDWTY
ncbi:predicted protein [Sclerotinia sclerotiorum 1980 UF-70]|uniref:Uncharacterized protein n=1 Tax=Sclerotinia sclerotiorum (strain ATCC 18683 / 1980 / Ss-1) TaxID=665079 RepID=A7ENE3_SCLS1|nr:predicted protein [Sclerotinia sclerotiorum 1980 UF-70]EDO04359.1 predicted protein [Sclerotinia sclerotiorum 1980 UF-70]